MKKIMFNDRFNLTRLVLEGRKNMTRRVINSNYKSIIISKGIYLGVVGDKEKYVRIIPKYELGEVVAIAQSYQQVENDFGSLHIPIISEDHPGWHNKMFVKAECMPHKIQITKIRVERLQSISNDDCLNEGITRTIHKSADGEWGRYYWYHGTTKTNCPYGQYKEYDTARDAFAHLINVVNGKRTWENNPYVFVYEFKLIKDQDNNENTDLHDKRTVDPAHKAGCKY